MTNPAKYRLRIEKQLLSGRLDASWELDIWGGGRRQSEAAQALFKAAAADLDNVRVTLVAEIADTYIGLRTAQEQLRISRENLKLQRDIAGLVTENIVPV